MFDGLGFRSPGRIQGLGLLSGFVFKPNLRALGLVRSMGFRGFTGF